MITPLLSAFLQALGWALLNSLWQFGILWVLYVFLIGRSKGKRSPVVRHNAALVMLAVGSLWFMVTLWMRFAEHPSAIIPVYHDELANNYAAFSTLIDGILPYLSSFYLLGVAFLTIKFIHSYFLSKQLRTQELVKPPVALRLHVAQLAEHLSIPRKAQLWISQQVDAPMVTGFLKPVILLPFACLNQLTPSQLEAILLHELAHIKRNDYLINILVSLTGIIFFFNPFARLFIKAIQEERELCCDDLVLQFQYPAQDYAAALLMIERNRSGQLKAAIAANGTHKKMLLQRVQRMLAIPGEGQLGGKLKGSLVAVLLVGGFIFLKPLADREVPEQTVSLAKMQIVTSVMAPVANTVGRNDDPDLSQLIPLPNVVIKAPKKKKAEVKKESPLVTKQEVQQQKPEVPELPLSPKTVTPQPPSIVLVNYIPQLIARVDSILQAREKSLFILYKIASTKDEKTRQEMIEALQKELKQQHKKVVYF